MRQRQHASCDDGRSAGRRAQCGVGQIPGVARDVDRGVFCGRADAELRRRGPPDEVQPRLAHLPGEKAVVGRPVAAHEQRAHLLQPTFERRAQVFDQERHAGKKAVASGAGLERVGHGVVEDFDHRAEQRVDPRDAGRRLGGQFGSAHLTLARPLGQRHAVVGGPLIPTHRQCHVA